MKKFFLILTALFLVFVISFCDDSTSPNPLNIAGTWTGAISSPTAQSCNVNVTVVFTQSGTSFTGNFTIPGNATGVFQGSISGNSISGVFTEVAVNGCTGSGNFSGSASSNSINASVPSVTSSNPACQFCQQNTVSLTR
jgi:hypothetical protein